MRDLPTLLLVHGAWHGPWCWQPLIEHLPDVDVRTVALPSSGADPADLGDLYDDAAAVAKTLASIGGPTVIVGHSYGGSPITEAATHVDNVVRLVYVTALMLDVGDSVLSAADGVYPPYWHVQERPGGHSDKGFFTVSQPLETLYGDVDPELARLSAAKLGHQSLASVTQPLTEAAWRAVPSTYVVCEADAAIPVPLQEAMAQRAQRRRRLDCAHSPFLSKPAKLARILREELGG
ncbi:alpha/beta hydrolase [Streptomyces sp. NPDC005708]|uniref:alpha/beta hydrolase n=1 Tax=Streptomyces sp. NPDC005708 TaxID=3154564 RepID=UPI0033EF0ECA